MPCPTAAPETSIAAYWMSYKSALALGSKDRGPVASNVFEKIRIRGGRSHDQVDRSTEQPFQAFQQPEIGACIRVRIEQLELDQEIEIADYVPVIRGRTE